MSKITYTNKVDLTTSSVAAINKVVAADMNEIKSVVNDNDDLVGDLSTLDSFTKTSVVAGINSVVESGTGYIKYLDGTMICYSSVSGSIAIQTSWGSLYKSSDIDLGSFPQTFISTPQVIISAQTTSNIQYFVGVGESSPISTTKAGNVCLLRPTTSGSAQYVIDYIAIGKWK